MAYVYCDLALHIALPARVLQYELSSNSYFNADVVPVYYQAVFAYILATVACFMTEENKGLVGGPFLWDTVYETHFRVSQVRPLHYYSCNRAKRSRRRNNNYTANGHIIFELPGQPTSCRLSWPQISLFIACPRCTTGKRPTSV